MIKLRIAISSCALLSIFGTGGATAADVSTNVAPIKGIYAYESFGGGDVAIFLDTGVAACQHGAFLAPGTPGFKNMMAMAMSSYLTNKPVRFQVEDTAIWSGSSNSQLCRAKVIRFE